MKSSAISYYLQSILTLNKGISNLGVLYKLLLKLPLDRPFPVHLRNGTRFYALTLLDVWVLKETILDRAYELAGVPMQKGWTLVDIGAALGDFTVWSAQQVNPGRVIAVEPSPTSVELLEENVRLNRLENVSICEGAVGSENGMSFLNMMTGEAALHSTADTSSSAGRIEVKTLTLEELFNQNDVAVCDYLKLDCEGAEYDILMHARPDLFDRIDRICMEVHDGVTVYSRHDLQRFLEQNGYVVRVTPNPVHDHLAYLYAERLLNS